MVDQRRALAVVSCAYGVVAQVTASAVRLPVHGVFWLYPEAPAFWSPEWYCGALKPMLVTLTPAGTGTLNEPPLRSLFMLKMAYS